MGLQKYTIYKYVRTDRGWRYCRPAFSSNNKTKPNVVLVRGREEAYPECCYIFQVDTRWERVSESAAEPHQEQKKLLARQLYQQQTGETPPEPEAKEVLLRRAIDEYLTSLPRPPGGRLERHPEVPGECLFDCTLVKDDARPSTTRTSSPRSWPLLLRKWNNSSAFHFAVMC